MKPAAFLRGRFRLGQRKGEIVEKEGKAVKRSAIVALYYGCKGALANRPDGCTPGRPKPGFVYLSDPFIRRLVGPQMKLCERRRMLCYNHMRMIGHAAMLYRTQFGTKGESIGQFVAADCLPERFGQEKSRCPCGGTYQLSDDGATAVCSHHGHADRLVPCCEIPLQHVTRRESKEYKGFVEQYSRYRNKNETSGPCDAQLPRHP